MADYWKSIPKYWCKHCSTYVTDTKLGRANHEATGKHQSGLRRALRDLHRDHERQEREKDKAQREVARLNGLTGGGSAQGLSAAGGAAGTAAASRPRAAPPPQPQTTTAAAPRREQLEQLADLGVRIPDELRGELAMTGDWTVTATRVVEEGGDNNTSSSGGGANARAAGAHKRPRGGVDEGHGEEDEPSMADVDAVVQGLFKRPRQWGRATLTRRGGGKDETGGPAAAGEEADLDSLLSRVVAKPGIKQEGIDKDTKEEDKVKKEEDEETEKAVKKEDGGDDDDGDSARNGGSHAGPSAVAPLTPTIKQEPDVAGDAGLPPPSEGTSTEAAASASAPAAVFFKKRKPKHARQK